MAKDIITIFISNDDLDMLKRYTPLTLSYLLEASKGRISYESDHLTLIYGRKLKFDVSTSSLRRNYKRLIRYLMITESFYYHPNFMVYECLDRLAAQMLFRL